MKILALPSSQFKISDFKMFPMFKSKKTQSGFEMTFGNGVTVSVQWSSADDSLASASASHSKSGWIHVTSFETRYAEGSYIVHELSPEAILKFMNKACSMRFTEEGDQCIAFFDF